MIPLETTLDPRLWKAVSGSYQSGNFTAAIIDAIQFVGDLIREKTGLESDGVARDCEDANGKPSVHRP